MTCMCDDACRVFVVPLLGCPRLSRQPRYFTDMQTLLHAVSSCILAVHRGRYDPSLHLCDDIIV